ncbi:hypothetical protein BMI86_15325 [Thioclava sp. DLFJ5-1]|nr:hypothetical protein BMI86_15325 [Thioclava sp. DLFJ5-1]
MEVRARIREAGASVGGGFVLRPDGKTFLDVRLLPSSHARVYPDYIPAPLREDYVEACQICDLSPKASATLARRCLQGMIRDFANISKGRLIDEISTLKKLLESDNAPKGVSPESIEAIDAVRSIGNIGAHMEKDISVIVDVDPEEARTLIELIEMLFEEWYIAREKRQTRLQRVVAIAEKKAEAKQAPKARSVKARDD